MTLTAQDLPQQDVGEDQLATLINRFFGTQEATSALGNRSRLFLKRQFELPFDSMLLKAKEIPEACKIAVSKKYFSSGEWSENIGKTFSLVSEIKNDSIPWVQFSKIYSPEKELYFGFVLLVNPGKGQRIFFYEVKKNNEKMIEEIKCHLVLAASSGK